MNRARGIFGTLLLSALAVSALGAANASALTMHECVQAEGTATEYTSSTCETEGKGGYHTTSVTGEIELENTLTPTTAGMNVTAGEEAGTHIALHFVSGGIAVQITCTGATGSGEGQNEQVGEAMKVSGTGHATYTGCKIAGSTKAAENCQVPETLEPGEVSLTTEADKVVIKPNEGTTFITIPFTSKAGKTCPAAILGEKKVTGVAKGSVASPTSVEFTSESGSELKLGEVPAQLTVVTHVKGNGGCFGEQLVALETP